MDDRKLDILSEMTYGSGYLTQVSYVFCEENEDSLMSIILKFKNKKFIIEALPLDDSISILETANRSKIRDNLISIESLKFVVYTNIQRRDRS